MFINSIVKKYGNPNIIIDDGDHRSKSMIVSLENFWEHLQDNGIYIVEDIHGVFWQPAISWDLGIFRFISKQIFGLNAAASRGNSMPTKISRDLFCISSYWSVFVLHKRLNMGISSMP